MGQKPPSRRELLRMTGRLGLTIGGATLTAKFLSACGSTESSSGVDGGGAGRFDGGGGNFGYDVSGCDPYHIGFDSNGDVIYGKWYCDEYVEGLDCDYNTEAYESYLQYNGYCVNGYCYESNDQVPIGPYDHNPTICYYGRYE